MNYFSEEVGIDHYPPKGFKTKKIEKDAANEKLKMRRLPVNEALAFCLFLAEPSKFIGIYRILARRMDDRCYACPGVFFGAMQAYYTQAA